MTRIKRAMEFSSPLPIDVALPELTAALRARNTAVLVAPPGAGKTTRVPLVLAEERARGRQSRQRAASWCSNRAASPPAPLPSAWRRRSASASARPSACGCGSARKCHGGPASRSSPRAFSPGSFSTIRCSTASPPSCSTNSTSVRSMPISDWRSPVTRSLACARICGLWSCRRRSTARAWRSSLATRR